MTYWGSVSTGKGSGGRENEELVHLGKGYLVTEIARVQRM